MLAEQLAARVGMPAATLKRAFAAGGAGKAPGRSGAPLEPGRSRTRASAGRGNLLSQAITRVLQHPGAARFVKDIEALSRLEQPGVKVLKELLDQAAAMEHPTTAMLLERWRSRPEYARLGELALSESMVTEEAGAAKELQMAVEKLLEEYGPARRMDELLRKAEELGLNYDEKTELSLLLKAKGRPRAPL
jgi:DNA primase